MKGSLTVIAFFAAGIAVGYLGLTPSDIDFSAPAMWVLYLLVATIGFEFGYRDLLDTVRKLTPVTLLLPLFTIVGTLLFAILTWTFMNRWSLGDWLALASGMGYYSLSSVLIVDYRKEAIGLDLATQLGTIALLANLAREIIAVTFAPLYKRFFGDLAPIAVSGVTSLDVALPIISRVCGRSFVPTAIVHGVIIEIAVPLMVYIFCL